MHSRRLALVSLALAAGLAGCSGMYGTSARAPQMVKLMATLGGGNEVPPNTRPGTGMADVQFNRDTGELRYTVTYSGLSGAATGAHIHGPAAAGANAPVVVPFTKVDASPITGTAMLNPTQAGDLMAGLYYVNVHTAAHPGGEIRGQLRLAP